MFLNIPCCVYRQKMESKTLNLFHNAVWTISLTVIKIFFLQWCFSNTIFHFFIRCLIEFWLPLFKQHWMINVIDIISCKSPEELFKYCNFIILWCSIKLIKQVTIEVNIIQSVYRILDSPVLCRWKIAWMIFNCVCSLFYFIRYIIQGIWFLLYNHKTFWEMIWY